MSIGENCMKICLVVLVYRIQTHRRGGGALSHKILLASALLYVVSMLLSITARIEILNFVFNQSILDSGNMYVHFNNRLSHSHSNQFLGYNHTRRWTECSTDNLALMILNKQFSFHAREPRSDYVINRIRYGLSAPDEDKRIGDTSCRYYGWGSRRNVSTC